MPAVTDAGRDEEEPKIAIDPTNFVQSRIRSEMET